MLRNQVCTIATVNQCYIKMHACLANNSVLNSHNIVYLDKITRRWTFIITIVEIAIVTILLRSKEGSFYRIFADIFLHISIPLLIMHVFINKEKSLNGWTAHGILNINLFTSDQRLSFSLPIFKPLSLSLRERERNFAMEKGNTKHHVVYNYRYGIIFLFTL